MIMNNYGNVHDDDVDYDGDNVDDDDDSGNEEGDDDTLSYIDGDDIMKERKFHFMIS